MTPTCSNCGEPVRDHCRVHLVPCCPGACPDFGAVMQTGEAIGEPRVMVAEIAPVLSPGAGTTSEGNEHA